METERGSRRRTRRRCVVVAVVLYGLCAPTARADYKTPYIAGLRAAAEERWTDALTFFTESAREAAKLPTFPRGELVRPYGTWTESYLPDYQRGVALFELGDYAAALDAWGPALEALEGERAGGSSDHPLTYQRNRSHRSDLERRLEAIPRLVDDRYEVLAARLTSAERRLEAARRYLGARGPEGVDAEALPEQILSLRERLEGRGLGRGEGVAEAQRLREDEERIRAIVASIESLEAHRMSLLSVDRVSAEEAERDARRALVSQAEDALRRGDCPAALASLRELVGGRAHGSIQRSDRISPFGLLAEATLECGDAEAAGLYYRMALRIDDTEPSAELGERARSADGPAPERDAVAAYLEALGWIGLGECRDRTLSLLQSAANEFLQRADFGESLLSPYGLTPAPYLAQARAHHNCSADAERDLAIRRAQSFRAQDGDALQELKEELRAAHRGYRYEASYALIVSVWDYAEPSSWPPLPGARDDIEPVRRALARLGFRVLEPLENPTKDELMRALRDFAKEHGTEPGSRLVVYYAGHGTTWQDPGTEASEGTARANGFLVPADAPAKRGSTYYWDLLSMEELQTAAGLSRHRVARMQAHHVMFAFDACFGGSLFDELDGGFVTALTPGESVDLLARPSRFFLTAGGADQTVPDFSVFRRFLISALQGDADLDGDGVVLGQEIGQYLRPLVSAMARPDFPNTPQWAWQSSGAGADGAGPGDVGFERRPVGDQWPGLTLPTADAALASELALWSEARCPGSRAECQEFLEVFPDGWLSGYVGAQFGATNFQ